MYTMDDICLKLESEGFRAKLSVPQPNVVLIESGHCGLNFNIMHLIADDEYGTTVLGFSLTLDSMSLSKINYLNQDLGCAKVQLDDDYTSVGYRLFIKENDLTESLFHSHFVPWLGDLELLSRQIGR